MSDTLRTGLETIDADCESAAKIELEKLFEDVSHDPKSRPPSPQAVEAILLRLITRKEQEFIQEIGRVLKAKSATSPPGPSKELIPDIETLVDSMLADSRYVDRLQHFYQEAGRHAPDPESLTDTQAKRLELIDATYRTGVRDVLRRARQNILAVLNLYKHRQASGEDLDFMSTWRRYSTLSPWRSIGTIILLSLTSYLIAFIIASDTFRALLERLGFSSGTGL
jgi:NADH dehydrogenase/NADH:ubiquinone oxidoreductase subunit G